MIKKCSERACNEPVKKRGMCEYHYYGLITYGDPNFRIMHRGKHSGCKNPQCDNTDHYARGFCKPCYKRFQRNGTVEYMRTPPGKYTGCFVKYCKSKHHSNGFCGKDYKLFIRGKLDMSTLKKGHPYGN